MLRYIIFIVCAFASFVSIGQNLSPKATVSLITCGPGNDLYATFGHSAIQINDPVSGIDRVYNYGTFDFNTPNFYLKFARGKLNYYLNVTDFRRFSSTYIREGRWVYRQELNMTTEQKEKIFALLEENAKPENSAYKYDFFYDNCSTRIRDILEKALGSNLIYPENRQEPDTTFRELLDKYLQAHPWSDLGIDLALGMPCDQVATWYKKMFLPDYLMLNMEQSRIISGGEIKPLILKENIVLEENSVILNREERSIVWIFWTIFVLTGLLSIFLSATSLKWFDLGLYSIAGILGIVIILLWFATDHSATKWNFNVLWALPTWLMAPFYLIKSKGANFFRIHAVAMFALVVFWMLVPQNLNAATVPVILMLGIRSWAWNKHFFQKIKQ